MLLVCEIVVASNILSLLIIGEVTWYCFLTQGLSQDPNSLANLDQVTKTISALLLTMVDINFTEDFLISII